ncbi:MULTISPECIES: methyltransferase domain-containing protein [unclassified Gordonia (in: high G+C Gram-positive bacteria)]|jgi:SAM-dependent methyltransferase|uniref:SAM-dependent methyltransferase n=1 Tax=unclassified Gordonia (in: high G+C Gram-positive bacteria) TaxID=2657482 RepID=UPI00080E3D3A|nr:MULTISPECIES: methyltransferase domain-containing protein [unclassified Gordonia (in: high G+C Gram-positive bacteria)]OCH78861.1 methyltransferase [Gordonia sp. UCD-TK1]OCW88049.1 methyltransferase [Nocardia farcinica]UCZ90115.1 class I SAM-dependent methyltransferase [Gordonia sp. WA4-43]WGJ87251.1 methyltransferase domain-containing protein [Gordonia sp. SMJS1]
MLSPRLAAAVDALPLAPGLRVLEIGCGPGPAAREVARRVGPDGFVLGIDRSPQAVNAARRAAIAGGFGPDRLDFDCSAIEDFDLGARIPFDVAFALRVGALDGRHPDLYDAAVGAVARALRPGGVLLVDGGDPLRRIELPAS